MQSRRDRPTDRPTVTTAETTTTTARKKIECYREVDNAMQVSLAPTTHTHTQQKPHATAMPRVQPTVVSVGMLINSAIACRTRHHYTFFRTCERYHINTARHPNDNALRQRYGTIRYDTIRYDTIRYAPQDAHTSIAHSAMRAAALTTGRRGRKERPPSRKRSEAKRRRSDATRLLPTARNRQLQRRDERRRRRPIKWNGTNIQHLNQTNERC